VTKGPKSVQYGWFICKWYDKGWEHNGDGKHKRDIQTLETFEWKKKNFRKTLISKEKKRKNE
jgi:hypothetical protein